MLATNQDLNFQASRIKQTFKSFCKLCCFHEIKFQNDLSDPHRISKHVFNDFVKIILYILSFVISIMIYKLDMIRFISYLIFSVKVPSAQVLSRKKEYIPKKILCAFFSPVFKLANIIDIIHIITGIFWLNI